MEPVQLSDERLLLRPWRPEDALAVHAAIGPDPEIARWTASIPWPYSPADAEEFAARIAPAGWASGESATFGVFAAADATLLASVGLSWRAEDRAELGYWCAAPARGRGVTTDAARLVCRWGFDARGLSVIEWKAIVGNVASRRVAERLGFVINGVRPDGCEQRGVTRDAWYGHLHAGRLR